MQHFLMWNAFPPPVNYITVFNTVHYSSWYQQFSSIYQVYGSAMVPAPVNFLYTKGQTLTKFTIWFIVTRVLQLYMYLGY